MINLSLMMFWDDRDNDDDIVDGEEHEDSMYKVNFLDLIFCFPRSLKFK